MRWLRTAGITDGPVTWLEAIEAVRGLNATPLGTSHWRLPNINELESFVDCDAYRPALPVGYPFAGACDAYWSSTTSLYEPDWA